MSIAVLTFASFCSHICLIFVSVTSHAPNATTDLSPTFGRRVREQSARNEPVGGGVGTRLDRQLRASFSSTFSVIFNTTPVNCTPFIPPAAYQAMLHLNANDYNEPLRWTNFTIPDGYLHDCLSSIHYDRQLPTCIRVFLSPYADNQLAFPMTVSELVGYSFDGKLTLKVNIELEGIEPRLQWDTSASINNFS